MVGLTDADEPLYPLCGAVERLAYDVAYDGKGSLAACAARNRRAAHAVMTRAKAKACAKTRWRLWTA